MEEQELRRVRKDTRERNWWQNWFLGELSGSLHTDVWIKTTINEPHRYLPVIVCAPQSRERAGEHTILQSFLQRRTFSLWTEKHICLCVLSFCNITDITKHLIKKDGLKRCKTLIKSSNPLILPDVWAPVMMTLPVGCCHPGNGSYWLKCFYKTGWKVV